MTVTTIDTSAAERRALRIGIRLDAIADNYEQVVPMIAEALELGDHETLGYRSPGEYLADRFGKALARMPMAIRRETVAAIDAVQPLSTRSLAPVFDVTPMTISNDRRAVEPGVKGFTPEPELPTTPEVFEEQYGMRPDEADALISSGMVASREEFDQAAIDLANVDMDTGGIHDAPVQRVTGMDGKTYTRPEPAKPKRRPLPDAFFTTVYDLGKHVERLARLTEDDRFPQNAEKVAAKHRSDLLRARDLLQQVINSLPESECTTS